MNSAVNKMTNKNSVIDELTVDGIRITKPNDIANTLGNYFASVGENYANKIPNPKQGVDDYIRLITENVNSLYFCPTVYLEVNKIISKLPNRASSEYDKINNRLLKLIKDEISKPLTDLFNMSLSQGTFPSKMKLSEIVPLHKGNKRTAPENYRPISLLVTISKILEKLVYKRVYDFLQSNDSFYDSQYSFQTNHSTDMPLLNC